MSATMASTSTTTASADVTRRATPSFFGLVRGELFKIVHLRVVWIMSVLLLCFIGGLHLILLAAPNTKDQLHTNPLNLLYTLMEINLSLVRIFGGVYILVLAAHVVGLEYQHGTIRILLGRGVGRLQLLGAKLLALVLVAAVVLVVAVLFAGALSYTTILLVAGNTSPFSALNATFWANGRLYLLTVVTSMAVTLLLGVAAAVAGRTLAFGLGVGLSWFAADNLAVVLMLLAYRFTHNDFWQQATGYFLGPVLNVMPAVVVPTRGPRPADTIGAQPLVTIDGTHAWLVVLAYAVVFAAVSVALIWRRDVLE